MAHSKYSDERAESEGGLQEHTLHLLPIRKYDPSAGADSGEGGRYSHLVESCVGDWSWKPGRDRLLGEDMVTFKGVPPGGAELYRGRHA